MTMLLVQSPRVYVCIHLYYNIKLNSPDIYTIGIIILPGCCFTWKGQTKHLDKSQMQAMYVDMTPSLYIFFANLIFFFCVWICKVLHYISESQLLPTAHMQDMFQLEKTDYNVLLLYFGPCRKRLFILEISNQSYLSTSSLGMRLAVNMGWSMQSKSAELSTR